MGWDEVMVRALRIQVIGLLLSLCVFQGSFSSSALAASRAMSMHNSITQVASVTCEYGDLRFPDKTIHKRPVKCRDRDDLGM